MSSKENMKKSGGLTFSQWMLAVGLILVFSSFGALIALQADQDDAKAICYNAGYSAVLRAGNDKYCYMMDEATDIVIPIEEISRKYGG